MSEKKAKIMGAAPISTINFLHAPAWGVRYINYHVLRVWSPGEMARVKQDFELEDRFEHQLILYYSYEIII